MSERHKITASHLSRLPVVYLRQSTATQVEHNRESTKRQYALAPRARELGWPEDGILVIDSDLGLSGSGAVGRSGFLPSLLPMSLLGVLVSYWGWKSLAWRATMPTGTASSNWPG